MSRIGVSSDDDWRDAAADVFDPEIYVPPRVSEAEKERNAKRIRNIDEAYTASRRAYDEYTSSRDGEWGGRGAI